MAEHLAQSLSFFTVLGAGLSQSINPASFLGCFIFVYSLVRVQKRYGFGQLFGALVLFWFLIFHAVVHVGVSDYLYAYFPKILLTLDGLRILIAIKVLIFGVWFFLNLRTADQRHQGQWKKIFFWGLPKAQSPSLFAKCWVWISAFFLALFLALFCGTWILNDASIQVFSLLTYDSSISALWKLVFFELCALAPFFIILFFLSRAFRSETFRAAILNNKLFLIALAGFCVAIGAGTIMHYILMYV